MASMADRLQKLVRSPQGQKVAEKAKEMAEKPENQRRISQLRERLMRSK